MVLSDLEQQVLDLDWYALDEGGCVGQFVSGGSGGLPPSVISSPELMNTVHQYFAQVLVAGTRVLVDEQAVRAVRLAPIPDARSKYVKAFERMASRGLFAYDSYAEDERPTAYFRVCSPEVPLLEDQLPKDVRQILARTRLRTLFKRSGYIGLELLG